MGFKVTFLDGQEFDYAHLTSVKRDQGSYVFFREGQRMPQLLIPMEQVRYMAPYDDAERAKLLAAAQRGAQGQQGNVEPARVSSPPPRPRALRDPRDLQREAVPPAREADAPDAEFRPDPPPYDPER